MPYIVLGNSFYLCLVHGHLLVIPVRNKIGGLSGSVFFVTCPGVCFSLSVRESVFRYLSGSVFFVTCPGVCFSLPVRESVFRYLSGSLFFVICPGVCFLLPVRECVFCYLSGSVFFVACLEVFISVRKPFFFRLHHTVVIALT